MKVIQELVAYFERRGRLTHEQMAKLLKQGYLATDAPPNMVGLCRQPGQTYYFRVEGADSGSVWGTDVYTGDSVLAAAAVHAGAVKVGETGVVKVTVVEPLNQYRGTTRHGVTTHSYGRFDTAYRVDAV
jgi:LCCL domain